MNQPIAVFCLFSLLTVGLASAHETHGQPQNGGIVAEAGLAQFEIVGKDGRLTIHVTNHGAAVDTVGARGRLTVLAGTAKQEIELLPAGGNLLKGQGSLPAGAKLLLSIQWPGQKALQARAVAR